MLLKFVISESFDEDRGKMARIEEVSAQNFAFLLHHANNQLLPCTNYLLVLTVSHCVL